MVRIFDAKNLASASLNKARKLMLYSTYRGGMPEGKVITTLKEDYNKYARAPVNNNIKSIAEWEQSLQGKYRNNFMSDLLRLISLKLINLYP